VLAIAPADISYRAMRGTGFVCQTSGTSQLRVPVSSYSSYRDPQPGRDSALIFVEGDPDTEADDSWQSLALTNVSRTLTCPAGLGPAITLTTLPAASLPGVAPGTPVRIYEVMQLRLYRSEGKSWLGARSVSSGEAIQPVVGPLRDGDGFLLEYLSSGGVATTDRSSIKSIRVTLRGVAESSISQTGELVHPQEELVTQVLLRNSIRP
jgi:hypothetical protein